MHRWYVTTPTVSDTGGPNELDTTENGRGGPLLVGVFVEPARPEDELVHSDGNGPPLEEMKITARIKLRG